MKIITRLINKLLIYSEDFNHGLNNCTTQVEIQKAFKNLNNDKAKGKDGIRNKYLSDTAANVSSL